MFPIALEAIIYLKYNKHWWGMSEVNEAMEMNMDDLNQDMQDILNIDDTNEDEFGGNID